MRRAERFIHSMPSSPTVTMPTSTESRTARVRSACAQRLARTVPLVDVDNEQIARPSSSASSTRRSATCTQTRLPSRRRSRRSPS